MVMLSARPPAEDTSDTPQAGTARSTCTYRRACGSDTVSRNTGGKILFSQCTRMVRQFGVWRLQQFCAGHADCGDFILAVVLATVVYSQRKKEDFDLEKSAVAVGTAGIFMLLGVLVYAAADPGEIDYQVTDLHVGWAMCVAGGSCLLLAVHIMYRHVNHRQPTAQLGYYPISDRDDEIPQRDVALLQDI